MTTRRLDAAWVLGLLADIADEILDPRTRPGLSENNRREIARLVLSRVHDVQQLDPEALPCCRRCGNSGAVDVVDYGPDNEGPPERRTVACDCGHAMVQPGDAR